MFRRSIRGYLNLVLVAQQKLLKLLSLVKSMVTNKSNALEHLDIDSRLVTQRCLSGKGIVRSISNQTFLFSTNKPAKRKHFIEYKVLGRANDDISSIVSPKAPHKLCQEKQTLPSVTENISTEDESSLSTSQNKKQTDC